MEQKKPLILFLMYQIDTFVLKYWAMNGTGWPKFITQVQKELTQLNLFLKSMHYTTEKWYIMH